MNLTDLLSGSVISSIAGQTGTREKETQNVQASDQPALLGALSGNKGPKFFCNLLQAYQRIPHTTIRPRRKHRTRQHR